MAGPIAFATTEENVDRWTGELRSREPDIDLRVWPDVGRREEVAYAIVARPPGGALASLPNLKGVLSMWAGVEGLLADPALSHVPIVRMVEPGLTNGIVAYVVHHVLGFHMHVAAYEDRNWVHPFHKNIRVTRDATVGILGFGHLGHACARALTSLGFEVAGFSNSRKRVENVRSFAGASELPEFLSRLDVLVCILPRTPDTDEMLNSETLAMLPQGCGIVNCGRGEVIDDAALLAAIDGGHIAGAVLDVFREEPLPKEHPFWKERRITISPHCASKPDPRTGSDVILANIARLERGEELPPGHLARRSAGY